MPFWVLGKESDQLSSHGWKSNPVNFTFQVTLAIHCARDATGCQFSDVQIQFVFLEQIHNTQLHECQTRQ